MDVKGFKPGQESKATTANGHVGGVGFGERMSICGHFAITKQGIWRELERSQQLDKEPAMDCLDTSGTHLSGRSTVCSSINKTFWCG